MLSVSYYFRKYFPTMSYEELHVKEKALSLRLSTMNAIFVLTCGILTAALESKFGRLYCIESFIAT